MTEYYKTETNRQKEKAALERLKQLIQENFNRSMNVGNGIDLIFKGRSKSVYIESKLRQSGQVFLIDRYFAGKDLSGGVQRKHHRLNF